MSRLTLRGTLDQGGNAQSVETLRTPEPTVVPRIGGASLMPICKDSTPDVDPAPENILSPADTLWDTGDRRGEYDCFLGSSSTALDILDEILEKHAGERWSNPLIVDIAEARESLDDAINHGVRLHNCILAMEHNESVSGDLVLPVRSLILACEKVSTAQLEALNPQLVPAVARLRQRVESSDKAVTHEG